MSEPSGDETKALNESILKLEANNNKLKDELINSRGTSTAVFEALGIDPKDSDAMQKVASFKANLAESTTQATTTLTENEKLRAEVGSVQTQLSKMVETAEKVKSDNEHLALSDSIKTALGELNVDSKNIGLLLGEVTRGLSKDENGFFAMDGESKLSHLDYAKKVVERFPHLVNREVVSGSGSGSPQGNQNQTYRSLVAEGKYSEAEALGK